MKNIYIQYSDAEHLSSQVPDFHYSYFYFLFYIVCHDQE